MHTFQDLINQTEDYKLANLYSALNLSITSVELIPPSLITLLKLILIVIKVNGNPNKTMQT